MKNLLITGCYITANDKVNYDVSVYGDNCEFLQEITLVDSSLQILQDKANEIYCNYYKCDNFNIVQKIDLKNIDYTLNYKFKN